VPLILTVEWVASKYFRAFLLELVLSLGMYCVITICLKGTNTAEARQLVVNCLWLICGYGC
jgi:hypothetical protein